MNQPVVYRIKVMGIVSTKIPGTLNSGTAIPILLPYHSHKNPLKYGNDIGGLWEGGPTIEGTWKNS